MVFRAMKRDADGFPTVAPSASALGVRLGVDVDIDAQNQVIVNEKGMSVSPSWRSLSVFRIPKRLGGQGSNNTHCFKMGAGVFEQAVIAERLELIPDSDVHGVIRAIQSVPLTQYEVDLGATRTRWMIEET